MPILKIWDGAKFVEVPILDGVPGGELGGTWAVPTVDITHSGSPHHIRYDDAEAIAAVEGEPTLHLAGAVFIGVDDTTPGTMVLYGDGVASGQGGALVLHMAADHDATFENWTVEVYEDDFRIMIGTVELFRFKAQGGLQLGITGPSGGVLIGGDARWYRGALNNMYLAAGDVVTIVGGAGDFPIPVDGMFWYNQTTGKLRGYEAGAWGDVLGGGGGSITKQHAHAVRT